MINNMSKKTKQLIGYIILLAMLFGIITIQIIVFGLINTLEGWGIGALFVAIVLFACHLIKDGDNNE